MRIVCLDLDLGPGRNLLPADLNYFLTNGSDVIAYFNSNGFEVSGWDSVYLDSIGVASEVSLSGPTTIGIFKKWAVEADLGDYKIIVLDLTKTVRKGAVEKRIKKSNKTVIVVGDWSSVSDDLFNSWRDGLAYYGRGKNGILTSNASTVTNITNLAVDHNGHNVVAVDFK